MADSRRVVALTTGNVINFFKHADKQSGIDIDLAKRYFVEEVLPYIGKESLLRLINANNSGDQHSIQAEMMRVFIEAEIARPPKEDVQSKLNVFFNEFNTFVDDAAVSKQ